METRQKELKQISRLLVNLGYILDKEQPHISGERFLASPDKLVLVGKSTKRNLRVIIKMSRLVRAKDEIRQEKKIRDLLSSSALFKKAILLPKEVYFGRRGPYQIFATEFVEQERVFITYPLKKQISIILKSFQKREKLKVNNKFFPSLEASDYLENFKKSQNSVLVHYDSPTVEGIMNDGLKLLQENEAVIERYGGYLVHSDFAPHNFRVSGNSLYTLDCSAFQRGNKYEEMARFLNYMVIHNPALESKLKQYILNERGGEEYLDLKLMRIYKIGYLLEFYTRSLSKASLDLHALTSCRIEFWEEVMRSVIQDRPVDEKIRKSYVENRDNLRSAEEKSRQREFALA